ncbi:Dynein regulatory complex protein [Schistosoma japonicum]|uniref:Dynein regulatory complex protein n=2 Tax=Schistosoma japonicum TaxID=6182 RepID=A0A4Z2DE72_SCHJA|nr:Dynein regulatory complex protein [Schistosoma japonicum]
MCPEVVSMASRGVLGGVNIETVLAFFEQMSVNNTLRNIYIEEEKAEHTGPSVDSHDIEQRIAARRIRIKNRLEFLKHARKEEIGLGRSQLELSNKKISKLIRDGDSFITNIRVACDARENLKRAEDHELNQTTIRNLENETAKSLEAFNKITERWEMAQDSELLDETKELLDKQNTLCKNLIAEKNKLINELSIEVKAKDDHYVRELKKRTEDIDLLAERMESQIKAMQRIYREEIIAIENAFLDQREKLTNEQNTEWEILMNEIKQKQINYLKQREDQVAEYEKEFYDLRTKYSEEYNALKISLGAEVETLESHLQKLKSTYQLNLEKLDYNYQVLKRRDEEATVLKSNQKRRITRLQDTLNNLHIKSTKQEKQYSMENEQLSEDYKKRMENYRDLQKKSKLLLDSVKRNFHDIWIMNEENLKKQANRLLEAHRIITEQQLGLTWNAPDTSFMDNVGPLNQIPSKPPAVIAMELALQSDKKHIHESHAITSENKVPTTLKEVSPKIIQEFLHLLCYEPEFLIGENMKRLLEPLGYEDGLLLRLDTILTVLGVQTEEDLNILFTYFIKQHKNDKGVLSTITEELSESNQKSSSQISNVQNSPDEVNEAVKCVHEDNSEIHSINEKSSSLTIEHVIDQSDDKSSLCHEAQKSTDIEVVQPKWSLISPVQVVDAIYQFTEDIRRRELPCDGTKSTESGIQSKHDSQSMKMKSFSLNLAENIKESYRSCKTKELDDHKIRDDSKDLEYWNKYKQNIVTEEWEEIWNNLYMALGKYSKILKHRAKLIHDTDGLRKQNAELRHLLQQYMSSKVRFL